VPATEQDVEHLKMLSIGHYAVAIISAILALVPIVHFSIGLVILIDPEAIGIHDAPPRWLGLVIVGIGAALLLIGFALAIATALAGRYIEQRRRYAFVLVTAAVNCLAVPFGTVLGILTLLKIVQPRVRDMFQHPAAL
jgi:hypothetical protein